MPQADRCRDPRDECLLRLGAQRGVRHSNYNEVSDITASLAETDYDSPNEMRELSDGHESALNLGNLETLLIVCFYEVVQVQEIGNGSALDFGESLDLLTQGETGTLEERRQQGVILAGDDLAQERILISGLIPKDEDVHGDRGPWGSECIGSKWL